MRSGFVSSAGRLLSAIGIATGLLHAQATPSDPLLTWLDRQAQAHLDERDRKLAAIRTRADAEQRRQWIQAKLLELLGGLPDHRGPLNARVTGKLEAGTHVIEKVIFESLPGIYITGNLYRPVQPGKYPGVLVPSGHTQEGKPETQELAANLAAKGFVALSYDPIGQGEREQTYLPQLGRALSGGGGNEHLELGARSILIGQSVARYFIHDARRGVDYLVSRPDVDADRIGVTGCSGGGAITTYVGVFEPRVKAAAPGCFINSFRTMFTGPTPDSEMSFPRILASGLDTGDFFFAAAPLPWLMMATTEDYFPPGGARAVYEEARRFYSVHGSGDRVEFFVGTGPHGTPRDSREAIYRWLTRWLKDGKGETADRPVKLFTNLDLRVTASGSVDGERGSRKFHQEIAREFQARRKLLGLDALRARLRELGVASEPGRVPAARDIAPGEIEFESEAGVVVRAKVHVPAGGGSGRRPGVVVIEEKRLRVPLYVQPSQSTAAVVDALVKAGAVVLELDPRDSPGAWEGRPFLGNWVTNERADLVGRNLPAMRANDVLAAVNVLAARPDVDPAAIGGYGRGVKGFWLLMAAAADRRIGKVWLDRTPVSFAAGLKAPLMNHLFDALVPSFALHWDIQDLVALLGNRRVLWTDPANWMNRVTAAEGAHYRYRTVGEGDAALAQQFVAR